MENSLSSYKIKNNFIIRLFSSIIIVPAILVPILLGGYVLIFFYLFFLTFTLDELFSVIRKSSYKTYSYLYTIITIFSFIIFMILLIATNEKILFIYTICIIWVFDTFSYLGGTIIKGKKIFPKISKGKTYSGLLSGIIIISIFYSLTNYYLDIHYLISYFYVICVILLSFVGDTLVSFLKRSASMKDSGSTIPGHGGFLDRFDSFILVFFLLGIVNFF